MAPRGPWEMLNPGVQKDLPLKSCRRVLALTALLVAVAATVATIPASAQSYRVTVELADGTLQSLVMDLPEGTTVDQLVGDPSLPGTPVALEAIVADVAQDPPPADPAPSDPAPTDPAPTDPAPTDPAPTDPAPTDPAPTDPAPTDPAPTDPAPTDPAPTDPAPVEEPVTGAPPAGPAPGAPRPDAPTDAPDGGLPPGDGSLTERPSAEQLYGDGGDVVAHVQQGRRSPLRNPDGSPTRDNPGFVDVLPGPSMATGVPNFIIRKFRVPPFLLPIYQAAGIEYGVRWEILAAINEIESDYGRNLNVSSAGAIGWMQFMPSSWRRYGVDANKDGHKDPYNPVDAIFAAANYLKAAGYENDVRGALFAYNHADWYVDSVLLRARLIAGVPADLIGSLTGLTEARFPVRAHARYADDLAERKFLTRVNRGENAARVIESDESRRSIAIFTDTGAPVVAVNDGVIQSVGRSRALGRHVLLEDVYGNSYTYARLGRTSGHAKTGARVRGGVVLGRVGAGAGGSAPHLDFSIQPAGRGAPRIDPKPILDGWKLLEATSIYRANGNNVLRSGPTIGQILLLSKAQLQKRVLADERIEIYECGRADIGSGQIDRRVLATLAYLSESGLSPSVSSLRCGHSYHTKSGNVSEHSSGNAVDISRVNGIPVLGHQEAGGIADQTVRRLMQLQGAFAPHQVISLFSMGGPTLAMADHADHIHVGFRPAGAGAGGKSEPVLKPDQWPRLMERLRELPNPIVRPGARAPGAAR
jgi:Transglycosylase SLT domain/Peptidase family M23